MIQLAQITAENATTGGSVLALVVAAAAKHFLIDSKRDKKRDESDEEKTVLLQRTANGIQNLTASIEKQISVSEARREAMEEMVRMRHQQNLDHMNQICKFKERHNHESQ